jgi:hypothetical protein
VYDRAVADKDEVAKKEILPILLEKQMHLFDRVPQNAATQ